MASSTGPGCRRWRTRPGISTESARPRRGVLADPVRREVGLDPGSSLASKLERAGGLGQQPAQSPGEPIQRLVAHQHPRLAVRQPLGDPAAPAGDNRQPDRHAR